MQAHSSPSLARTWEPRDGSHECRSEQGKARQWETQCSPLQGRKGLLEYSNIKSPAQTWSELNPQSTWGKLLAHHTCIH